MPVMTSVDHHHRLARAVVTGRLALREIFDHFSMQRALGGLGYPGLYDVRHATLDLSRDDVLALAQWARGPEAAGALRRTAVVVDSDVSHATVHMLNIVLDTIGEIRPFSTIVAAENWLRTG